MQNLNRTEAEKVWQTLWEKTQHEWFKVELLQNYFDEDDGPSLQAWLRGDKEASIQLLDESKISNNWVKFCQTSPARKIRIRVTEKPYSPYLEWELNVYRLINVPLAGEEIYLIPSERVKSLRLPEADFTIFDQKYVIQNYYSQEGGLIKADSYNETDDISFFLNLRAQLLENSTKFIYT